MHVTGFNWSVSDSIINWSVSDSIINWSVSVSIFVFLFLGLLISIPSYRYVSLSVSKLCFLERGGCLTSAKLGSTDSVNPRSVISRVRPRYRPLL